MYKLAVIVPYRDRENHLKQFIPYITSTLQSQNINYKIVIIEQNPGELFNRGLLCNIGASLYKDQCDYICIHDIDIIGEDFDYRYESNITHLSAKERHKKKYKEWYDRCIGGVTLFPTQDFIKINGFSNEYWGWGAEDDDLRLRCDVEGCKVQRKQYKYYTLYHETMKHHLRLKNSPGYKENLEKFNSFLGSTNRKKLMLNDGLSSVNNLYLIDSIIEKKDYTLIKTIIKKYL